MAAGGASRSFRRPSSDLQEGGGVPQPERVSALPARELLCSSCDRQADGTCGRMRVGDLP
jgi:hypothetical protein